MGRDRRSRSNERRRSRSRDRDRRRGGGGRHRSRSPRERRRSRSRDRERRDRDYRRDRDRSSRDRDRKERSTTPPKKPQQPLSAGAAAVAEMPVEELQELTEEEIAMRAAMGFGGFETTKNKKVEGVGDGIVRIVKKQKYRQYMNRRGGFNRPLDT